MNSVVVGISGGSGSGKTTFAEKVIELLGRDRAIFIAQDHYYNDFSSLSLSEFQTTNFDHPDSIDFPLLIDHVRKLGRGEAVKQPIYDFSSHTRTGQFKTLAPKPVIIVDGILIFSIRELLELMSLKVFIDVDADIRLARRIERDIRERGREVSSVVYQYINYVKPMHDKFVEPSRSLADLILEDSRSIVAAETVVSWIKNNFQTLL
ncbi:MAG: uridine kinase [Blastocatellia bacterium]|nr:uridine kinase [Blastocatellia bacterium]